MDATVRREIEIASKEAIKLQKTGAKITIKTRDDLLQATDLLATVKRFNAAVKKKKAAIIGPMRVAIKEVNELFADPETRGAVLESNIKSALLEYQQRTDRAAAKKAAKLEEKLNTGEIDMQTAAGKLGKIQQTPSSVDTENGQVQFRTVRKIRIVAYDKLPTSYFLRPKVLEAIEAEIRNDVLKMHKPCPTGAEVYEEKIVAGVAR